MRIKNKCLLVFYLLIACAFLLMGCTININIDHSPNDAKEEAISDQSSNPVSDSSVYQSSAVVYFSNTTDTETAISSSDLKISKELAETYSSIFQSEVIQSKIREEYPDVEYTLSLEPINETTMFAIITTGEAPDYLEEICNMAVSLLCENIQQMVDGISCKIVNYANPARLVETN